MTRNTANGIDAGKNIITVVGEKPYSRVHRMVETLDIHDLRIKTGPTNADFQD